MLPKWEMIWFCTFCVFAFVLSGAVTCEHATTFCSSPLAGRAACSEGDKGILHQRSSPEEGSKTFVPWCSRFGWRKTSSQFGWKHDSCKCLPRGVFILFPQTLSWQVYFPADRVLLKKPQRDGIVVEYQSYVTEVRLHWHLQNQMWDEFNILPFSSQLCLILFSFRFTMKRSVWEWTWTFSKATSESRWKLSSLITGWTNNLSLFQETASQLCFYINWIIVTRLNMRRCHNALELTKDFKESKIMSFCLVFIHCESKIPLQISFWLVPLVSVK